MSDQVAPSAPTSLLHWVRAGLLALTVAWSVLALGAHPAGAFLVSLVLTLAVVAVHLVIAVRSAEGAADIPWPILATLPFLGWAAASAAWVSDVAWLGWIDWLRWMQGVALFWVAGQALRAVGPRRLVLLAFAAVAVGSVLLACYQFFVDPGWLINGEQQWDHFRGRPSGPFFAPTTLAGFLVLIIPPVAALTLRRAGSGLVRVASGWLLGVLVFGLVLPVSRGAWLALAGASVMWFIMPMNHGPARRAVRVSLAVLGVVVFAWLLLAASPATRVRFEQMVADRGEVSRPILWRAAWDIFLAHPLVGSGGGSYPVAFEAVRPEGFTKDPIWAHSDYLNVLSDYGAVGALLAVVAACALVRTLWAPPPERTGMRQRVSDWAEASALRTGIRVGLLALALQAAVDFHFRVPGVVVAAAVLAGLAQPNFEMRTGFPGWRVSRGGAIAMFCAAGLTLVLFFGPLLRGEAARREGRRLIDGLYGEAETTRRYANALASAERLLRFSTEVHARNAQAWSDLAYVLALRSHLEPDRRVALGVEAEAAADRAVRLAPGAWEPWVRRSVARDLQGRWLEAGDDVTSALVRAPANAEAWYYSAYHFSHRRQERFITLAAVEFCLRLDPQNRGAQALRAQISGDDRGAR